MKPSFKHIITFFLIIAVFVLIISCVKKDFKQASSNIVFNPTYSLPIGEVSSNIYAFIPDYHFDCFLDTSLYNDTIRFIQTDGCLIPIVDNSVSDTSRKNFDFSTIGDQLENATFIMFVINYSSYSPGITHVTINFNDGGGNPLFTLFELPELIIPPETQGQAVAELTPEEIDLLINVREIEIITTVNISNLSQRVVIFNSDKTIDVQIGLKAELEIDTDNL